MVRLLTQLVKVIPGILALVFWQFIVWLRPENEFFIGSPIGVIRELVILVANGSLFVDILVTSYEAVTGFIVGSITGTCLGLALWSSDRLQSIARPYIGVLGAVPIFALGPIVIFWFGTGILSKIVLGFLSTFAIAVAQAYTGAVEADENLQKLLRAFGASRMQIFTKLIIPSSAVWVLAGVRLNIGMALLGAFIGEFIASKRGLGHLIIVAEGLFNINQVLVGVLGIISIATLFLWVTAPIEKWAKRWRDE
jgi:NitT/TauT family transport system permease protein